MPTGRFDEYTKLEHLCSSAANYPSNGIRTRLFGHALAAYKSELETRSTDLFQAVQRYPIDYLEAFDGDDFQKWACHSASQLRQHYQINRKEPLSRFICIQAESSISPLDCSKDVFTLLLSFHHVMPRFLDLVFAFGQQAAAVSFHHENFLEAEDTSYSIPRLGRSGRQLQNCYNLWGVEKSDANGEWSFRQMAVYHSFDVESCRSLWINIKANDLMLERITDMATTSGRRNYNTSSSPSSRFAATLVTHMLFFEWCTEGWRSFISSLEKAAHEILMKVENAPIQDVEKQLRLDYEAIMPTSPTTPTQRRPTFPQAGMQSRTSSSFRAPPIRKAFSGSTTLPVIQSQASATSTGHPTVPAPQREVLPKNFSVLKEFSVKSLQRLGGIGSKLQKASLMMQLDAQVLDSVVTHYDALLGDERLSDGLRNGCYSEVSLFREEAASYIRQLGMEQSRIAALEGILRDGRNLLNTILQYKNTEINKMFTVNAQETSSRVEEMTAEMHQSALRMESLTRITGRIAEKTERETSSMHIITLVTLVFLPGTFVAVRYGLPQIWQLLTDQQTLFGSGLYQWDQNNPEMEFPLWKQKYFNLFAKICFPLMFFVIVVWYCVYWWSKRKENKKGGGDEENLLLSGEKDAAADGHDDSGDN